MISEERIAELWRNTVPTWVIHAEVYGGIEAFARAVEAEATAALRAENKRLRELLMAWSHFTDEGIDAALKEKK